MHSLSMRAFSFSYFDMLVAGGDVAALEGGGTTAGAGGTAHGEEINKQEIDHQYVNHQHACRMMLRQFRRS